MTDPPRYAVRAAIEFLLGLGRSTLRLGASFRIEADGIAPPRRPRLPPPEITLPFIVAVIEVVPMLAGLS